MFIYTACSYGMCALDLNHYTTISSQRLKNKLMSSQPLTHTAYVSGKRRQMIFVIS